MSIKVDKGSAGGGGNSFGTIQTDAGTSPSADQANDTLTLTSSDSTITITGNSTTDTVTFNVGSSVYKSGGTDVAVADGGTGASTATAGFNALSPTTTRGDLITRDASNNVRLAIGSANTVLKSDGTDPSWGNIVNANVDSSADIARSKLASGTASHVIINDGSGVMSSEAALAISRGGTGQSSQTAAFDALAPTTTKGDIIVNDGNDNIRLAVGTNNYVLTADSSTASGVKWAAASGGASGVDSINALIINPIDRTYVLDSYAPGSYTIDSIGFQCSTGTCTLAIKINGTNVTSLSALSVSSTPDTASASGANSVVAGDRVTAVVTSSSVIQDLEFSLKITRS